MFSVAFMTSSFFFFRAFLTVPNLGQWAILSSVEMERNGDSTNFKEKKTMQAGEGVGIGGEREADAPVCTAN